MSGGEETAAVAEASIEADGTSRAPGRGRSSLRTLRRWVDLSWRPVLVILTLFLVWELWVRWKDVSPTILPTPTDIAEATWRDRANIWGHTWVTLQTVALGFSLALFFAVVIGVVTDSFGSVRRSIYPVIVASQTLPIVAIAPLVVIWFGFDIKSHAFVVALYNFFPITVGLSQGLASTNPDAMNLLRTMGAGRLRLLLRVRFPSALPQLFTGIRVSVSFAVAAAVIAQFVGAVKGLGIYMLIMKNSLRTDLVFGAVAVTATATLLLFGVVVILQRVIMPWYRPATQGDR